ncbi:DUF438 domain-containing protein [Streptococcus sp. zg-86]|uniref:DUF438 domain-containing protein n=1 Tax=Streptococcus zhangguiae TaxID=2664091 RepID=A0A6I4RIC7_9STRE|nr:MULTISPECIES: DUF438 domain-containing protein [unclassified Streptococcus]MTB64264.1 DUF438 domain-containing protein [Streptococcus sp. zg-86]MTB90410.1 DUF438 domain-containing protein [Streptococcus sp. zg-36]MWV56251.1 DUF438 domain-containing protein [Streptococcus sp. zg-70]QTH48127.1 DUF438 domain-containing protein [Streptococcus sp. zg-86]
MTDERIHILKDILLDLHQGASPDSVQERFNQTFAGVSAIEISLMEHELMNSDSGVTFEDVMSLCDVHANLFKQAIQHVEVADADQAGHPVRVFKDENLALRAALIRIRRLLESYEQAEDSAIRTEIIKGLQRQLALLGQFDNHYRRKEELFFPLMEKYGHDSPPKVMWGVDDQIRDLFAIVQTDSQQLEEQGIEVLKQSFEAFAVEFESMIFKEESILLMILLECFTQDDWLQIAGESDTFGYAIIRPKEKWTPERHNFTSERNEEAVSEVVGTEQVIHHRIDTPDGELSISFTPKKQSEQETQAFGNGYLSIEQANLILNHLPMEITFVNKDDIFQYYNDAVPSEEMIFKRTPSQVGRHVELCHPPKLLPKVRAIFTALHEGRKDKFEMWFNSESRGQFVHVTYKAVRDVAGEFQGVLEYVQDIAPYRAIETDVYREIDE